MYLVVDVKTSKQKYPLLQAVFVYNHETAIKNGGIMNKANVLP